MRWSPIERGKWWLRRRASTILVARLDTGPWIRVSGAAEFEWDTLAGGEVVESRTAALFVQLLRPGLVLIDVGANVGYYALTAAARIGPSGRVVAFEPTPVCAARVRENAALNDFQNLCVIEAAVSDRAGTVRLRLSEDSEGNSLYGEDTDSGPFVDVVATTLDQYAELAGLDRVDILKVDAEGAEVSVIRGASRVLSRPDAPVVLVEANPLTLRAAGESPASLRAALEALGYAVSTVEGTPWRGVVTENWLAAKTRQQQGLPEKPA